MKKVGSYKIDYDKILFCPICSTQGAKIPMEFHHAYVFHAIYDVERQVGIWACDEKWKCPQCRLVLPFGHPITKAQYDATIEAWHGNHEWATKRRDEVAKRLRDLGYLDVEVEGHGYHVRDFKPDAPVSEDTETSYGPPEKISIEMKDE